jgi:hypothetical protein
MPKLTEDLVPGVVTLTTLHKVLQNLLDEKYRFAICAPFSRRWRSMRRFRPIRATDLGGARGAGRAITQRWFPGNDEVQVIGLDTPLERLLLQALQGGGGLEPGLADRLLAQTQEALARQEMLGAPPVLLVNHALRPLLSRFLRRSLPQLVVLSNMELSDNRNIRMTATIGGNNAQILPLLCLLRVAQAAGEGPGRTAILALRSTIVAWRPRHARCRLAAGSGTTLVAWNIQLNGPTPAGLRTRLCSLSRCTELDALSGTTMAFSQVSAAEPFRFIWEVPAAAINSRSEGSKHTNHR